LGNPGPEYAATRHNVGFMAVDELARRFGTASWKNKHGARQAYDGGRRVVLLKPTTYMNLSGSPIRLISAWYRTPPQDVLVIYDEMDLPFGKLRMRPSGGHAGHNGARSVIAAMGEDFPRIRIGVGRPQQDSIDHVLGEFTPGEREKLKDVIGAAADGAQAWLDGDFEAAMRLVNGWPPQRD